MKFKLHKLNLTLNYTIIEYGKLTLPLKNYLRNQFIHPSHKT